MKYSNTPTTPTTKAMMGTSPFYLLMGAGGDNNTAVVLGKSCKLDLRPALSLDTRR
jgi:hypothetical protein